MQPLPALKVGPRRTITSAYAGNFVGNLRAWDSFEIDTRACFHRTIWRNHTIQHSSGRNPTDCIHCGSELDVQARWTQNLAQYMSAVAHSQEIDCTFGGYHCTVDRLVGNLVPDMVIMTSAGATLGYLEVKPDWIPQ
ncbi:hypothetical protein BDV19DRAFT_391485 [Aspergillus venezuelensis]